MHLYSCKICNKKMHARKGQSTNGVCRALSPSLKKDKPVVGFCSRCFADYIVASLCKMDNKGLKNVNADNMRSLYFSN